MTDSALNRRQLVWLGIATAIGCAILIGLGVWQLQRLQWKQALIAQVAERMAEEPAPLPPASQWAEPNFVDDWRYRPVTVVGVFGQPDPEQSDSRPRYSLANLSDPNGPLGGVGYWVMTPFFPEGGGTVYVNRGFVPSQSLHAEAPPPQGPTTIVGILLPSQPGNFATPDCESDEPICYTRDVALFASGTDNPRPVAPFFVDLRAEFTGAGGLPQAGETRVRFANNHLQYALTWFGLALALAAVSGAFAWSRRRR